MRSILGLNLILGGSGFLGRNLRDYFGRRGVNYVTVERAAGDLRDRDTVLRLFAELPRVDRIFHAVTFQRTGPRQYEIQAELFDTNLRIHLNILEAWMRHQPGAKLISTGSSCAYPEHPKPIPETMFQTGPLHESVRAYGLAKQALIRGSEVYATQYGLKWLHCILATMFGPADHLEPDRSHFIGGMMVRAIAGQRANRPEFTVWGAADTVRECLYVEDQIDAILSADAVFENTIVNCAADMPVTIAEIARAIQDTLDWHVPIIYPHGSFRGVERKVLDSSRFLAATDWSPQIGIKEGLCRLAEELRSRV